MTDPRLVDPHGFFPELILQNPRKAGSHVSHSHVLHIQLQENLLANAGNICQRQ